tara:strand:- start:5844 stop:7295 length:1452 start_codon:yes stop_codon:yes gene_type:complete
MCSCSDSVQAAEEDVFTEPAAAMQRARELGCATVHTHTHEGKTLFMPCSSMGEYKEMIEEKEAYTKEDGGESYQDIDKEEDDDEEEEGFRPQFKSQEASCDDSCPPGFAEIAGECVAVTCELTIESFEAVVSASTGTSAIRMSGIAFTSGYNKNGWQITSKGAKALANKMLGADITLNHPSTKRGRFTRNMDGGVDEAVVGIVTEADYEEEEDGYKVRFSGEVYREELFSALESGLWLREGYGVSIGGTGIPIATEENSAGRTMMTFEDDFQFDHLAIVHKPAYPEAKIESVEKIMNPEVASEATSPLIYRSDNGMNQPTNAESNNMSEDTPIQASEDTLALKEALVLAEARINAFEAAEKEAQEEARLSLVSKASEMGLSGVDDFSSEMLTRVIASWESSRPAPKELTPATPAAPEKVIEATEAPRAEVVANYLNGELVESDKVTYGKAWNAWASAWNGNLSTIDKEDNLRAPMFDDIKEMI